MRFFRDLKKYFHYLMQSSVAMLKSEVSDSYLSWIWWVLDPILYMFVYSFVAKIVFRSGIENFPVFVFIGLTTWSFFNKNVLQAVPLLKRTKDIVKRIYVPKQILILQRLMVNGIKMFISWGVVFIFIIVYGMPFHWQMLYLFPHLVVLILVSYAASCILMHLGVFINDMQNVITVVLQLTFYFTGIFFNIATIKGIAPWNNYLLHYNPIAFVANGIRNALMYQQGPDWKWLISWAVFSLILCFLGNILVYKYENSYGKVL